MPRASTAANRDARCMARSARRRTPPRRKRIENMPRKGLRPRDRRPPPPADYRYKSVLVSRLINKLDHAGRKAKAERVMYDALEIVTEKTKENALDVFTRAIENIRPLLEVKARRVGGATYQVPIEVSATRSSTLAMRWMLDAARAKTGKPMSER